MHSNINLRSYTFILLAMFPFISHSAALVWEDRYGPELHTLSHENDAYTSVQLSFGFPFAQQTYRTIFVGNNGGLELGDYGSDGELYGDDAQYFNQYLDDEVPKIQFNTDFSQNVNGRIHFNDFGHKAVFTWLEVGQSSNDFALSSFQIHLFADGRIYISFAGILDSPDEDMVDDMSEGIVLGIGTGNNPPYIDILPQDLSQHFSSGYNIIERWCHDESDSCGFAGSNDGLPGLTNDAFQHDFTTITFTPRPSGFIINDLIMSQGFE